MSSFIGIETQGREVDEVQHEEELKKYNEIMNQKERVVYTSNIPTMEQVLNDLQEVGEVVVKLHDDMVIQIKPNTILVNGSVFEQVEPTSEEVNVEYVVDYDTKKWIDVKPNWVFPEPRKSLRTVPVYTNVAISNSFTGEQRFKQKLAQVLTF